MSVIVVRNRYFIVVDDIWDISVWKMIRCALPTNNGGYIIITTTRIFDVAKQVGGAYYKMPNLCLQNSKILLHRRIFGIEDKDKYIDKELIKLSEKILHKYGGVPLAIIMISGLLATKGGNKREWYKVCNSIGTSIKDTIDEKMKRILSLSYDDLPSHLRTCLLYLSVFPEGYEIGKDRLIRIWIAEDLIQCEKQGESLFEIGERYFYELIDRGMIQPVYKRWYYDMTENCRVHNMVFELICYLSCKQNFVSILDHVHHTFPSKEIIQRLSLQNCMVDHATHRATMSMQEVRSVVVFPSAVNILPALASFRVIRVLDLQSCCLSQGYSLKYLENLVDLRYLGLRDTGISQLSREIGKLQFLQTLDVTDSWTRAPCGIGSFTSLEELSTLCIQDSTDLIEDLGNQTELRVLGIDCHTGWNFKRFEKSLVECLHKLQKIHTLSISVVGECKLDAWVAPPHLRSLEITGCCSSTLSAWLNPLLLQELSFLSIEVRKIRQEDLEILGSLPALVYLDVEVGNQNHGILRRLVFHDCSFPCLVHCVLRGYIGPVAFQQGAMVKLERLHLAIPVLETREIAGGFEFGLGNLPVLQDVTFLLRRGGAGEGEVEEAERALRRAIEMHPNHPTLEIL
ncbi:hypothetical protein SETIT_8G199800v2 [Setaria italica]|uniref:Uncharacterized protein n=3 Tax=Setaria italica TaxID=4555 RepID=A0A368S9M9_SETIT|nr:hypothetical protein SETIT_8G199800v2 [Setaria italica]RCV39136.1 hypothetical protein SETIT_8G199800v2 [Setaria italica]